MKFIGEKIKEIRLAFGMNKTQFSQILNISKKTLDNYENDKILPKERFISNLMSQFKISNEYIEGKSKFFNELAMKNVLDLPEETANKYYANYILLIKNRPTEDCKDIYYMILTSNGEIGGYTEFFDFVDPDNGNFDEIRILRPLSAKTINTSYFQDLMIINKKEDIILYFKFAEKALVKKEICEKYLRQYCEPIIVSNDHLYQG